MPQDPRPESTTEADQLPAAGAGPMLFADLVAVSDQIRRTSSRSAKTGLAAHALRNAGSRAGLAASWLSGALLQRRTGVGWRSLRERPAPSSLPVLTLAEVDERLDEIAEFAGPGSAGLRAEAVTALLSSMTAGEQEFLVGLLTGQLRQGASDGVLQAAVAEAGSVPVAAVRRALTLAGSLPVVAEVALRDGVNGLEQVSLEPGRALRPMLAGSASDVGAAWPQDGRRLRIDRKIDGIRVQAHKVDDQVRLFTRSLDDITDRLPEVAAAVSALRPHTLVLDGEVIAVADDGTPAPFQVTGARTATRASTSLTTGSGPHVGSGDGVELRPWFFDVLHVDGVDLVDAPLAARLERLRAIVPEQMLVPGLETADLAQAQAFFAETVAAGHEGVVLKELDRPYEAGRRGSGWVKVKPRLTLDLVVLAVERGSGRRSGWLSNIHLGARDPRDGSLVMVGKTFKGMTDEMLRWQTERFTGLASADDGWTVTLRPEQVVEVAFDGVQRSRRYPGGAALRFARVLRYRDDKTAQEVDTIDRIRAAGGL